MNGVVDPHTYTAVLSECECGDVIGLINVLVASLISQQRGHDATLRELVAAYESRLEVASAASHSALAGASSLIEEAVSQATALVAAREAQLAAARNLARLAERLDPMDGDAAARDDR